MLGDWYILSQEEQRMCFITLEGWSLKNNNISSRCGFVIKWQKIRYYTCNTLMVILIVIALWLPESLNVKLSVNLFSLHRMSRLECLSEGKYIEKWELKQHSNDIHMHGERKRGKTKSISTVFIAVWVVWVYMMIHNWVTSHYRFFIQFRCISNGYKWWKFIAFGRIYHRRKCCTVCL